MSASLKAELWDRLPLDGAERLKREAYAAGYAQCREDAIRVVFIVAGQILEAPWKAKEPIHTAKAILEGIEALIPGKGGEGLNIHVGTGDMGVKHKKLLKDVGDKEISEKGGETPQDA